MALVSQFQHLGERASRAAAEALRDLIVRKQVRLGSLSESTGIPHSTLQTMLSGTSELTLAELVQLAIALDVPAAEIVATAVEEDPGR